MHRLVHKLYHKARPNLGQYYSTVPVPLALVYQCVGRAYLILGSADAVPMRYTNLVITQQWANSINQSKSDEDIQNEQLDSNAMVKYF